jgi:hypothetical protein
MNIGDSDDDSSALRYFSGYDSGDCVHWPAAAAYPGPLLHLASPLKLLPSTQQGLLEIIHLRSASVCCSMGPVYLMENVCEVKWSSKAAQQPHPVPTESHRHPLRFTAPHKAPELQRYWLQHEQTRMQASAHELASVHEAAPASSTCA